MQGQSEARGMITDIERFVWVICRDHGSEGLEAPFQAFYCERDANVAMAMLKRGSYEAYKLSAVPIWTVRI